MIHFLIVDDEPIAHRIIEKYCESLPHLEKKGNCYNAFEAMQCLSKNTVDLVFLDINMPKLSGFDFLRTLTNPPKIIVTTAYKEFALEGYELNISDYLLKPFSFERFIKAVNTAIPPTQNTSTNPIVPRNDNGSNRSSFFIKGDKKHHQIHFEELLFIEAYGHYTKIYTENEMMVSHQKISSFAEFLPTSRFIRVHKSFIVSIKKISLIEGNRIDILGHKIPIGQSYRGNINQLFKS